MAAKKPPITRVRIAREELEKMTNEDFLKCWALQEQYVDHLENKLNSNSEHTELLSLRESEEKLKQQQLDATRRENILVMRLTTKEQEMQEYAAQIQELKQAQIPSIAQLRSALMDPAVNLLFDRMRKETDSLKARLEETQNELSAWKFTPDSNTGKRLMSKCRLLYQENEELGKIISSGRMAKLEGDLALQKSFSEEMKKSQSELDEFLLELDEDVEGMQSTIYYLQQQLRESKDQILQMQKEKQKISGMPNGSPNHRLITSEESVDTDSQSSHIPSSFVKNNSAEPGSPVPVSNDLNGTENKLSASEREIKIEKSWTPERNQVDDKAKTSNETSAKVVVNETSVILTPKEIKQEPPEPSESNVHSVIVENKNAVNHEKLTPLVERTNNLVDGLETNQHSDLRTSENTPEVIGTSEEMAHNTTSTVKRTSEGGRGRKRTRPRTPVEPGDKKEENLPVRKRTRRREAQSNEEKQLQLEFDTDTEVQVAQTLAYWATAKQERTEVQSDPNSSSVGNGELIKKGNDDK